MITFEHGMHRDMKIMWKAKLGIALRLVKIYGPGNGSYGLLGRITND